MAVGGLSTLVTQAACACCRTLADKMGLERVRLGSDGDQVTIWDGHSFVFNQSSWSVVNLYRMVRRRAASPRSGTDFDCLIYLSTILDLGRQMQDSSEHSPYMRSCIL